MKVLQGAAAMKTYIRPATDIVNLRLTSPLLDSIGIHHSLGLEEDASNKSYFYDEENLEDDFFDENGEF